MILETRISHCEKKLARLVFVVNTMDYMTATTVDNICGERTVSSV